SQEESSTTIDYILSNYYVGQSFIPSSNIKIAYVEAVLTRGNPVDAYLYFDLHETDEEGLPIDYPIVTFAIHNYEISTETYGDWALLSKVYEDKPNIFDNKQYFLVARSPSLEHMVESARWFYRYTSDGSLYPYGAAYTSSNGGTTWTKHLTRDRAFKIWGYSSTTHYLVPEPSELSLTTYAPSAYVPQEVTPGSFFVFTDLYQAVVIQGRYLMPVNTSLSFSSYVPTVKTGKRLVPYVARLRLTSAIRALLITIGKTLTPDTVEVSLEAYSPLVQATYKALITPTGSSLLLSSFSPSLAYDTMRVPTTSSLSLTSYTIKVFVGGIPMKAQVVTDSCMHIQIGSSHCMESMLSCIKPLKMEMEVESDGY
ncbi:MAG: hypothetical protein RBS96_09125, partial [Dehalococcoidales bacterium]|nr:hypothetical protein [Dehalococcoidales bacterium]